jgi:UDP:flavonoid glycosyltransferase YjiC (YdhE family)
VSKVLMLPSYLGGGYGHISRCLALADELVERGWQAAFALGGQHVGRVQQKGYPVYRLSRPNIPRQSVQKTPAYIVFSNFNYQLPRDGLTSPGIVRACIKEQLGIVRKFKPDILVSDSWPLAGALSHLTGIPVVQIVRTATHPAAPQLIWWQAAPAELQPPDPRPVINPVYESLRMEPVSRGEDLLKGDRYLVPSLPCLDPLPDGLPETYYTGPLVQNTGLSEDPPEWLARQRTDCPTVYITLGGGADPVGGPDFYRLIFEALGELPVQVIASTGAKFTPEELPSAPANFTVVAWAPGRLVIPRSDLIVYPGGYGTTMELVQAGVPGLVIPFHTEQESNGRRLEAQGAARVLLPVKGEPVSLKRTWRGGSFSVLVYPQSDLNPAELGSAVMEMLREPGYRQNIGRLRQELKHKNGAGIGADLIVDLHARGNSQAAGWDRLSWWQRWKLST